MKTLVSISLLLLTLNCLPALAQEQQVVVPYTLADRDRAILTDAKISALEVKMDVKFESVNARIEALETRMDIKFEAVNARIDYIFWLQGVIVALILFILGYTIWDRRTALQPALDKSTEAEVKSSNLIRVLREYSKKHADLAEILRTHGIL
ncbi:MAG: hypothetical protein C0397_03570 [Odoribacter sp.]|nr:hypothetical protein [Odoribacter sp.]